MTDYLNFDFDATQRDAWSEFTVRLDEVLSVMDASADLTISVDTIIGGGTSPSLHFAVDDADVISVSVTGGQAGGAVTAEEAQRLADLGWTAPSDGGQFVATGHQEDSASMAQLATATLTQVFGVVHPVFLEPSELAEILKGETDWTPLAPRSLTREERSIMPGSRLELDQLVDEELRRVFGHPPLRNEQGDVAIRVGSTMVFLRSSVDGAELVLFSPLVHEVAGRSRACEVLNDINVESRYGRFALHRDRVYVQLSVPAMPFVPAHLRQALKSLSQIADGIDDELASRLGGRTTF